MKKPFLPIVLGSDENAYGTVRLFREKYDVRPLLVCTRRLLPTRDSNLFDIEQIDDFDRETVFPAALLAILKKQKEHYEKLLVVACSDYYAGMMAKYYDSFEGLVANRFLSPELLDQLDTKDKFYALCEKNGMDYPKTLAVAKEERKSALDRIDFSFPIVVKPENSNAGDYLHCSFEGKKKVFFFRSAQEYQERIDCMNRTDYSGNLILQEFIPGGDSAMRTVNCYSDANGKVRRMCLGQPILEEYAPKMIGNYAAILTREEEAVYRMVKNFLEAIGYVGFSNFDMKYDRRSGKYMLFEINPRLGRSSFFVRGAGLNMMQALVEDVIENKPYDLVLGKEGALWTAVPKTVLRRYVEDPKLKQEALSLWKKGKVTRTLFCREDKSLRRKFRIWRYYLSNIRVYRKYYFNKEEIEKC